MVSDFRKKKLVHVFNLFDTDKSGNLEKKDFDLAIESISKLRGWKAGDAKYKEVEEAFTKIWTGLQSCADADKDGQVSQDEWIGMWDDFAKNPAAALEWQSLYCKFMFQLEDASNDGSIDGEEFSAVFASFGHNKSDAAAAFQKMAKGKPSVSWSEFQELWNEYYSSDDVNAPGNFIYGKTNF